MFYPCKNNSCTNISIELNGLCPTCTIIKNRKDSAKKPLVDQSTTAANQLFHPCSINECTGIANNKNGLCIEHEFKKNGFTKCANLMCKRKVTRIGAICSECSNKNPSKKASNQKASSSSDDSSTANCFSCPECQESFKWKIELSKHLKNTHPNKLKCSICNNGHVFSDLNSLQHHTKTHQKECYRICQYCKKFFSTKNLDQHIDTQHTKKTCILCKRTFDGASLLRKHKCSFNSSTN